MGSLSDVCLVVQLTRQHCGMSDRKQSVWASDRASSGARPRHATRTPSQAFEVSDILSDIVSQKSANSGRCQ